MMKIRVSDSGSFALGDLAAFDANWLVVAI